MQNPFVQFAVDRRADWARKRGQIAILRVGPFGFEVSSVDGLYFGFTIIVAGMAVGWTFEREG